MTIVPTVLFLFCVFVCLCIFRSLDSAASVSSVYAPAVFFFSNWPRLSSQKWISTILSSSSSPAVTERLIVRIQHPIYAPSFLCSYFVRASVPLPGLTQATHLLSCF